MSNRYLRKFGESEVERMVGVGEVGPISVRIWMRTPRPGAHTIQVWPSGLPKRMQTAALTIPDRGNDNTYSVLFPQDFPGLSPLQPLKRYRYRVISKPGNTLIGEGRFETSPNQPADTPGRFSIAVMSCHQPFDETSGKLSEPSMRMLKLTRAELSKHNAKLILLCGDQIYSDHPKRRSLLDQHYTSSKLPYGPQHILKWSAATVRKAYQQRYRQFFWMREVKNFYSNYPCYPILDDHEIIDDWGSKKIHTMPSGGVDYTNLRTGSMKAYFDYQALRVKAPAKLFPKSFQYSFEYGNVGVFVMDLRSQRSVKPRRLYGPEQLKNLRKYLADNADKNLILIVVSVPVIHLPDWLTDAGASVLGAKVDFADHWSYGPNRSARDRFLRVIYKHQKAHPRQRMVLVSGDVHIGCAFSIKWPGKGGPTLYQFTSSAISNKMKKLMVQASVVGPKLFRLSSSLDIRGGVPKAKVKLLSAGRGARKENPFGGLNLGIIDVEKQGTKSKVILKLIGYTEKNHQKGVEMFTSKIL
ncbi:MAG: alkaline phosphatase D family protein [Sedimentisphaerales bacterium]|nr:alkaline phosphatase D family protein [Sedimentisphaerales bacterium]